MLSTTTTTLMNTSQLIRNAPCGWMVNLAGQMLRYESVFFFVALHRSSVPPNWSALSPSEMLS